MIDDMLFQRGHITVRIGDQTDDYDTIIPEHYFQNVRGFKGEVVDSNGSEYELVSIDSNDNFVIVFNVYDNQFEIDGGDIAEFEELVVKCTGTVVQEDECDVLKVDTFDVVSVKL